MLLRLEALHGLTSWEHLQEISGSTDQSSESTTDDSSLVGSGTTLRWRRNWWGSNVGDNGWILSWVLSWVLGWSSWGSVGGDSGVWVSWGVSWLVAVYDISYCSASHN